ncbi:Creatinase/Prolidase domain protein [Candidatus Bealeia paramacronuclearis]|uniref:Creatinase/Prolidase domain protein n=2 Tax=Candidatus Bealeia paramacronuclearis TaxID=1921001 RepID=A0ABZ2C5D9_9PROT
MVLGFDPWLITPQQYKSFYKTLSPQDIQFLGIENPIDGLWKDQPSPPQSFAQPHTLEFTGESSTDKRQKIAGQFKGVNRLLITSLDSIAWLFNHELRSLQEKREEIR